MPGRERTKTSRWIGQSAAEPRIAEGSTTARPAPPKEKEDEDTVYSCGKPQVNIKDCTGYSGGSGSIRAIDRTQWEDYGNAQGASQVIRRLVSMSYVRRPANPTHPNNWTQLRYQKWNGESWQTIGAVPSTWYDCSTWENYCDISYDYVGLFGGAVTPTTQTKTFLIQTEAKAI